MAVVTGAAMRLEDWVKTSTSVVTVGLVASLYNTQIIFKDVPFKMNASMTAKGLRIAPGGLPTPTYGQLNNTPDRMRTTTEEHVDTAVLLRGNVYLDVRYKNMPGLIENPIKTQTTGLLEAWARQINTDFISNDPATGNKLAFAGLRTRLDNPTKYGHTVECKIDGSALDVSTGVNATKQKAIAFFTEIDRMLMYMNAEDGNGVVLYMNDDMLRAFSRAAKVADIGSGFDATKDNYDRSIYTYKNARLREIGRQLDETTRIITNTETATGAITGGNRTSIYGVRYGDSYVTGWHDGALELVPNGRDDSGTQSIYLLDYQAGLYYGHSRSITRLYGISCL